MPIVKYLGIRIVVYRGIFFYKFLLNRIVLVNNIVFTFCRTGFVVNLILDEKPKIMTCKN